MTTRPIELTEAQLGVLAAQLIDPACATFTVGEAVHLEAQAGVTMDDDRLRSAIARATAEATGMWLDVSADPAGTAAVLRPPAPRVDIVDLAGHHDPEAAAEEYLTAAMARAFDLTGFPLHEQVVLRLDDRRRIWLIRAHHVILDGYAINQVIRRALTGYAAQLDGDDCAPAGYAEPDDVVAEERRYLDGTAFQRDRAAWAQLLPSGDDYAPSRLLGASQLPHRVGSGGGPVRHRAKSPVRGADADRAAKAHGVTWADLAMTAAVIHLARHQRGDLPGAGARDVILGVPLMNRLGSPAARCPAMVTNVLPLRVAVHPDEDVHALAARVAGAATALRRHGRYRAERLQRDLGLLVSGRPLTLAELNIKLFDRQVEVPGVTVAVRNLAEGPLDDLGLAVERSASGEIEWVASGPAGADTDEVRGHLDAVVGVFAALAAAPDGTVVGSLAGEPSPSTDVGVPGIAARIEGRTLGTWPDPAERFARMVSTHPDRTALVAGDQLAGHQSWSYRSLGERVAAEAGRLRAAGVRPGELVAVDLLRGAGYVVALLALQRIGAVAVVLDAQWPASRRRELLDRLAAGQTVHQWSTLSDATEAAEPVTSPVPVPVQVSGQALAYVVHTSGSTGFPKAVGITRSGLGHLVAHHECSGLFADPPAGRPLRVAQTLPFAFDGSWGTLQGLLLGHEVRLVDEDTARDPAALRRLVADQGIDLVDTMPSFVAALLDEGLLDDGRPGPSRISVGGEVCSDALWRRLRSHPGVRVCNLYGPTEFTVDALSATGDDTGLAVIGRPHADTTALVLDRHLQPVPAGVRGELYLAGVQEARGYLGQPGLTCERFVANPFGPPGSRMYRTGDVVSVGADGLVRYHGRLDAQTKIRGFRVEPAEVEAVLCGLGGVSAAAVVVDGQRLLGYAVAAAGAGPDGDELRSQLAERLPAHLVPAQVTVLDALPVTTTGKLDPAALPRPASVAAAGGRAPSGPAEDAVARAVTEVLADAGRPGGDSDFFALGGDSITAIRVVATLRRAGWSTSVRDIFRLRTVAAIAAAATRESRGEQAPGDRAGADRDGGSGDDRVRTGREAPRSLVQLDEHQLGQLDTLMARRTRRKATR